MSFLSIFGKIGHAFTDPTTAGGPSPATIAAAGVSLFSPGLGALVQMIGNACYAVEGLPIAGAEKKDKVKQTIDISSPVILQSLQTVAGRSIAQPDQLAPALDRLIDDIVALYNAIGVFSKSAPAPQPATIPHAG